MTITPITVLSRIVDRKTGAVIAASIEQVSVPLADAPNDIAFSVGDVDMQADADGWYHIGGGKQVADNGESEVARG